MNTAEQTSPPTAALVLDRHSNGMLLTPEEFDAVEDRDENFRYELVRGVVIVSPPPRASHEGPIAELYHLLRVYQMSHPRGHELDAMLPGRYVSVAGSRRIGDFVMWCELARMPVEGQDVPTVVVEVVSRSQRDRRRDYDEKRREYAAAGVREYWILDPFRRVLTVHRGTGETAEVPESGTLTTPLLPGFELKVANLLARFDAWQT